MSAVLAAVQAGILLKHRGFDLDLTVSGPHTTGLDGGTELGPLSLGSRTLKRAPVFGTRLIKHGRSRYWENAFTAARAAS